MEDINLTFSFFLIFSGAAVFATAALFTKQPVIIAYIVLGALAGPYGFGYITDIEWLSDISHIGIIFLLFLLGLDMQPKALFAVFKDSLIASLLSSVLFFGMGWAVASYFNYSTTEALVIGAAMMFSSTIIGIKLLPTTLLHHKRTGEIMIGLLLLQDIIAILTLIIVMGGDSNGFDPSIIAKTAIGLPAVGLFSFLMMKFILLPLITKFDRFHEYIFLVSIGWCLGIAELSFYMGLSAEMGAFIAGVSIAMSPVSQYIAINLKPLRDFFLVVFFFSLGARFNLELLNAVIIPALILGVTVLSLKPLIIRLLILPVVGRKEFAWDVGLRLGQTSEFSLLVAYAAIGSGLISEEASLLIQATTIFTLIISSYIVVWALPNPIAIRDHLRRD